VSKLSAADLVNEIAQLDLDKIYTYVSGKTDFRVTGIEKPHGPIMFKRWEHGLPEPRRIERQSPSISKVMLATMALVCSAKPNHPIHIDRLFSGGGNTRSAFEALLAHTPHFFMCLPERVDSYTGKVLKNLKHIMWCPDEEHPRGQVAWKEYRRVITELEFGVEFADVHITSRMLGDEFDSIEAKTIHTQMQVALVEIGNALNFRTWIARNDRSIPLIDRKSGQETKLGDLPGVISSLDDVPMLYKREIKEAASLIDCIWFTDDDRMPAVIEIEHSTGVTSGLTRMRKFRDRIPSILTAFTVVAPNELRNKVIMEANQQIFRDLRTRYMPYSTVRELYGLIQRYSLSNVVDHKFILPFMEEIVD
jgi:type II restriction enzyme